VTFVTIVGAAAFMSLPGLLIDPLPGPAERSAPPSP
jgi:hypothetical protein